jgi:hypothetical protein
VDRQERAGGQVVEVRVIAIKRIVAAALWRVWSDTLNSVAEAVR